MITRLGTAVVAVTKLVVAVAEQEAIVLHWEEADKVVVLSSGPTE